MIDKFKNKYLQKFFLIYISALFYIICYSFHYNKLYYQILTFIIFIKICLVSIYFLKKKIENKEFTKIYYLLILFIIFSISVFANDSFNNLQTIISFFLFILIISILFTIFGSSRKFFQSNFCFYQIFLFYFYISAFIICNLQKLHVCRKKFTDRSKLSGLFN